MRPEIPPPTSERIERIYRRAGFEDPADLVRYATVKYLNELEADHHVEERLVRETFEYTVRRSSVCPAQIRLAPATESPVRFQIFAEGEPPHATILDTGNSFVAQDEVEDALAAVEGVETARVLTDGVVKLLVSEGNSRPLTGPGDSLVDGVYDALGELVETANRSVLEGEETRSEARERAIRDDRPNVS